ncbi:MAG: LysM peptidoglycan-binding domain-containing protein [Rikenellaceae bacterium]
MKKYLLAIVSTLLLVAALYAQDRSENVVSVGGVRYYLHEVRKGETIYYLSKIYEVSPEEIYAANDLLEIQGLKSRSLIKIPYSDKTKNISSRKSKRDYTTHKVRRGETLYSIANQYSTTIDAILLSNPRIDPAHLSVGQELHIVKSEQGKGGKTQQDKASVKEQKENERMIAPKEGYEYHLVQKGETIYSLAMSRGMSRREMMENNDLEDGLKEGALILLKVLKPKEAEYVRAQNFAVVDSLETLKISLLLPLSISGKPIAPFMEFYQGFLLGLEDLKADGRNVDLTLFNTNRNISMVYDIIEDSRFQSSHLIVGPVFEDILDPVVRYAEANNIPVISPLATLAHSDSDVIFQMSPNPERRYDKIGDIFSVDRKVTLIYAEEIDQDFESLVLEQLDTTSYERHDFKYEHPAAILQRMSDFEQLKDEMWSQIVEHPDSMELQMLLDSARFELSPADLTPLIDNADNNTFVVLASSETDVDRILAAFASANVGITSRGRRAPRFELLGNPAWAKMPNLDHSLYFKDGVVHFPSYHAKRDSERVRVFDSRYVKSFGVIPSLYTYRGYDVAKIFGEAMFEDIAHELHGEEYTPLQTTYRFQRQGGKSLININWMRVKYNKNFTITLE